MPKSRALERILSVSVVGAIGAGALVVARLNPYTDGVGALLLFCGAAAVVSWGSVALLVSWMLRMAHRRQSAAAAGLLVGSVWAFCVVAILASLAFKVFGRALLGVILLATMALSLAILRRWAPRDSEDQV